MAHRDLKFRVALGTALADNREAPWYGVWNWVLTKVIFEDLCSDSGGKSTTVTYPQYPLTHDIDTYEDGSPTQPSPSVDEDVFMSDAANTPSTPPTSSDRASGAPSPPDWIQRRTEVDITSYSPEAPSTPSPPPRSNSDSPARHAHLYRMSSPASLDDPSPTSAMADSPSSPRKSRRSTRIPDFAEILHEYVGDILRKHILLLVENKKSPSFKGQQIEEDDFVKVVRQTVEQVTHTFLSSDNAHINTIGVIVALGHYWKYVEYHRHIVISTNHPQGRSFSEMSYTDEEPRKEQMYYTLPSVEKYYDSGSACCTLGNSNSDKALLAVRKRMKELAARY
ncbi:hypothetical protein B0H34DRAFT_260241 [Crassisporium funariophilum]|nr:hypothetical protein B0H34DRAFT_260241 [Crassisporium funariophilum]